VTSPLADGQAMLIIPAGDELSADAVRTWVAAALVGVPVVPRLRGKTVWAEIAVGGRIAGLAVPPQPPRGAGPFWP
jgi:hypothetical protein